MFAINEVGISESSEITDYILIEKSVDKQAPSVVKHLKDILCGPMVDIELTCIFGGSPQPKVVWVKDGKKLKTARASYENRMATLVITSSVSSEGIYQCIATNEYGEASSTCNVEIQQQPIIEISEDEVNQKHRVNSEWCVRATIEAIPKANVTWYRNGTKIIKSKDIDIVTEDNISIIRILDLDRSHAGKYLIEAQNKAGTTVSEVVLRVFGKFYYIYIIKLRSVRQILKIKKSLILV